MGLELIVGIVALDLAVPRVGAVVFELELDATLAVERCTVAPVVFDVLRVPGTHGIAELGEHARLP